MIDANREKRRWFRMAFEIQKSVLPQILGRVLVCGGFASVISLLPNSEIPGYWKQLDIIVPSIVLGLLLVFRTNTAYDRFWEGRKYWGSLETTINNLARQIWVLVEEKEPADRETKVSVLKLLAAFAVATKLNLRQVPLNGELKWLMSPNRYENLKSTKNPPLQIAFWIGDDLQKLWLGNRLERSQLNAMNFLMNGLVETAVGCDRILKTPLPLAYGIHLKQLLLIYCLLLPFKMVEDFGWLTALFVIIISYTLFGIEQIGIEIENPFGRHSNDIPLDEICDRIQRELKDIVLQEPSVASWKYVK